MAGESPDRSKQRESSAEPTSGSAGTVPESREPRDPRLAVARDGDAPRGGVDTATRVFAVRELETERDAGAATGVATGDLTGGSADDSTGSGGKPSGDRDEETADGPSEGSVGGSGGGSSRGSTDGLSDEPTDDVTDGPDGESADDSGDDPADGLDGEPTSPAGEDTAADAGGATDRSTGGSDDGPGDETTDDLAGGPDGDAVAGVVGGSGASLSDESTGEVSDEPAGGPTDGSATGLSSAPIDDVADGPVGESASDSGDELADGPDGEPTSPAGDGTAADAGEAAADPETATAGTADGGTAETADALARPAGGDGATRDADDASGDAGDTGDDAWPAAGDDATRDFGTATARAAGAADDKTSASAGTVTADADEAAGGGSTQGAEEGPEGASEVPGEPGGGSDASGGSEGADGGDEGLPAAVARWATPAKPYGKPAADEAAGGEPHTDEADTGRAIGKPGADEAGGEPNTGKADAKADTGKAGGKPGADEAAQAEPGTKRAGAKTDADTAGAKTDADTARAKSHADGTGAKAKPAWADSSPVDQPTAVFKAPRPKPAVDQPTTMLKLGGATKPAEPAEAEKPEAPAPAPDQRTSKFVALKPDVTALVPQIGPERTTQQPLPPKPPLDLLAELTNTPPPPPTPLRTLGRRIKIWTPLVVLLLVVFAIAQAVRPLPATALELTAKDSYTFEGGKLGLPWPKEGQGAMDVNGIGTMDTFGDQKPVAIGSVAKAMTAYVVLKDHPLKSGEEGPAIPVDATAEKEGGYDKDGESTLNTVKEGDTLTERQALSAIMIPSANNIARLLARWDAGTEAEFIRKMNDTAKELGMTNTTYTDASGLKETTVSTAADQVKLGNELVKIPALVEITRLPEWIDPSGQKWRNYNTLVPYNDAIGIKTGSTSKAGGNLLFAATKESGGETVTVVGAILGQHTAPIIDTVNAVSKTALLAAQDAITSAKILKKGDVVGYVDDRLGGRTPVVVTKDVAAVGWAGLTVKLSFAADEVPHTAKAGTQVGTLTVGDGSSGAVKVPVALQSDLSEPGFSDKLTRIT
ncbi:D-alanyl-D-alanine carboxypeptidase [Streptomyces sp. CAI-85]|uniref:D-alanyl-D-alanine carboxypeptidase n=1 Tax=Streptomyces sp. CAI-85 TaxID=1472662 RepID=UPI002815A9DE|nr:D-alanyl-D-alanine carboxypeptidase [Streptomyces sp. CAI-85]